jgi:hypothetical protein
VVIPVPNETLLSAAVSEKDSFDSDVTVEGIYSDVSPLPENAESEIVVMPDPIDTLSRAEVFLKAPDPRVVT